MANVFEHTLFFQWDDTEKMSGWMNEEKLQRQTDRQAERVRERKRNRERDRVKQNEWQHSKMKWRRIYTYHWHNSIYLYLFLSPFFNILNATTTHVQSSSKRSLFYRSVDWRNFIGKKIWFGSIKIWLENSEPRRERNETKRSSRVWMSVQRLLCTHINLGLHTDIHYW